jgi:Tol biopolymer transport system component
MNIIGIKPGETFKFSDFYNRTLSTSFSSTVSIGGFPVGDPLIITQAAGPRPCILNPASGTVPNNPVTIQCDCNAKPVAIKPPVEQYDLVTRSSDNKLINTYYESWSPVIGGSDEDEGRYIAFSMYGKGIDGSSGNYRQIFWRDRKTGTTNMISKTSSGAEGNGNSAAATISADGRFVAFESYASNLCTGDQNAFRDVFVWDAFTGLVKLVSRSQTGLTSNGESTEPVISGDGNTIVFTSHANDIVKLEPVFSTPNIYVYNRQTGNTIFITKDYESGKATGGYAPAVSEDGNRIAFCAYSSRLVKNDNNNLWDIFLWQKGVPGLKRISMTETGGERNQGNESASRVVWPGISGDGNKIVFATTASNVVGDDKNGMQDIFLYNIEAGGIKRVSTVNVTTEGDGDSPAAQGERIGISYDGSWITYITNANNLGVPKGNIIKQHTLTGEIIPVTNFTNGSAARPDISKSGNYVVAGCSQAYDRRFNSSGIFVIFSPAHAP